MGIPKYAASEFEGYFLDWNKRRSKKKIKIKIIFNCDTRSLGKKKGKNKTHRNKISSEENYHPGMDPYLQRRRGNNPSNGKPNLCIYQR